MTIGKKSYAALTWRCLEAWPLRESPQPPDFYAFVTRCQVVWLYVVYPIAWPFVLASVASVWVFMLAAWIILGPVAAIVYLWGKAGLKVPPCPRVTWKEE